MGSKKALIFDMDGVIVDTINFHYLGWKNYLKKWNIDLQMEQFKNEMFGTPGHEAIRKLIGGDLSSERVRAHCENVDAEFRRAFDEDREIEPVAGVREFLKSAKEGGWIIGLGTSAPLENVNSVFRKFGIGGYFDAVVTSDDFTHGKPDPEVYLKSLERLGVEASDAVVFEDSLAGVAAGVAAGIKVIGLTTSQSSDTLCKAGAQVTFEDFTAFNPDRAFELIKV